MPNAFKTKLALSVLKFLKPWLADAIAIPLSKRPEVVEFCKSAVGGSTLRGALLDTFDGNGGLVKADEVYLQISRGISEFQDVFEKRPFVESLSSLNRLTIPDGDGDPSNDVQLGALISEVVAKVAAG